MLIVFMGVNLLALYFAYCIFKRYRELNHLLISENIYIGHQDAQDLLVFSFINKIFHHFSEKTPKHEQIKRLQKLVVKNIMYLGLLVLISRAMVAMNVV